MLFDELNEYYLAPWPPMQDYTQKSVGSQWQKPNSSNIFGLCTDLSAWSNDVLVVPHSKLGLDNRIFESMELVVKTLDEYNDGSDAKESVYNNLLSSDLSSIAARCQGYHSEN